MLRSPRIRDTPPEETGRRLPLHPAPAHTHICISTGLVRTQEQRSESIERVRGTPSKDPTTTSPPDCTTPYHLDNFLYHTLPIHRNTISQPYQLPTYPCHLISPTHPSIHTHHTTPLHLSFKKHKNRQTNILLSQPRLRPQSRSHPQIRPQHLPSMFP